MTEKNEQTKHTSQRDFVLHLTTEEKWHSEQWATPKGALAGGKLKWYNGEEEAWQSTEWIWHVTGPDPDEEITNEMMRNLAKRIATKFMFQLAAEAEGAEMSDFTYHSISTPLDYHWIVAVTNPVSLCDDLVHIIRWEN